MTIELADTDRLWSAVSRRDPEFDGEFVYGVRTTGMYSRPSCCSRRARRENVEFFPSPAEAERAGYRPCRRCRPAGGDDDHLAAVATACRMMAESPDMALRDVADAVGFSRFHFHRVFKNATGTTPHVYASQRRAQRLREELSGDTGVTDAVYQAGFQSVSSFYASSRSILGMSPTLYRAGAPGENLLTGDASSCIGAILVARTAQGTTAAMAGPDVGALRRQVDDAFPRALVARDEALSHLVATALAELEGTNLPAHLDIELLLPAVVSSLPPPERGIASQVIERAS